MKIIPIPPADEERTAPNGKASRRTFGKFIPSRRTFGKNLPSRRTFGKKFASRRVI
jgi:hypothetical protein